MANALGIYANTKFKREIVVDSEHCPNLIKRSEVDIEEIAFTLHIPFEQLNSWHNIKQTTLTECTYLQILNAFIGKKYSLKIQENCSRVDERLRILCTKVAKQLFGKRGGSRQNILANVKSVAVRHSELSTVALVNDLQSQVSQLQSVNTSITSENNLLSIKCKEASTLVGKFQKKIDKATIDIDKLKSENTKLYSVIEKLSPQRRFENQGKTFLEVGKRQQERKLQTLATRVEQALWFSESFGLHLDSVKLVDDSGKDHCLSIRSEKASKSYNELPNEEQEDIQQVLFIMDKFCIGEAAYHELTCCPGGEELPRSYLVKQCKENLNKLCSIERTPGEANGAAFDFHDELSTVIEEMVSFILKYSYHGQTYCCLAQYSHSELQGLKIRYSWPEAKVDLFTMFKSSEIQ